VIDRLLFTTARTRTHPSSPKPPAPQHRARSSRTSPRHHVSPRWQLGTAQTRMAPTPHCSPQFSTQAIGRGLRELSRAVTQQGSRHPRGWGAYRGVHPLVFQSNFILEKHCPTYYSMLPNIQKRAKGSSLLVEKKFSIKMRSLKEDFFLAASCTGGRSGHALQLERQNEQSYLRSSETRYLPQDRMKGKFTAL